MFLILLSFTLPFILPLILIGLSIYLRISYSKTSYARNTHYSYSAVRRHPGIRGEYLLYKALRDYEIAGATFLFNPYLPKPNGTTSEIDMIMLCSSGIFVFESKNFSGWIFGDDRQLQWTQTLPKGKGKSQKELFYNPILQNKAHIDTLRSIVDTAAPVWSVIVFSDRCTLKKITNRCADTFVIQRNQVKALVGKCIANNIGNLPAEEIEHIYELLYPMTQVSAEAKNRHVEQVKAQESRK